MDLRCLKDFKWLNMRILTEVGECKEKKKKENYWFEELKEGVVINSVCNALKLGFPGGSEGKVSTCNAGDLDSVPGLGRSSGEGSGCPLQ